MATALLLDIGGVVIRTPFELLDATERRAGLAHGALGPRGPFDPSGDSAFRQVQEGTLTEREYWHRRAVEAAPLLGTEPTMRGLADALFDLAVDQVTRPEVLALIADTQAADVPVGLLTNDLYDFHGRAWVEQVPVFAEVDVLVDASEHGVLKPDPAAFALGVDAMQVAASDLLLLDDQPVNVAGAQRAGLQALHVDVVRPWEAADKAREALGLA